MRLTGETEAGHKRELAMGSLKAPKEDRLISDVGNWDSG